MSLDLKRFPLPDGVPDAVLNRRQLATAFTVSENTIDKWRAAGMPFETEGGNGQAYEFKLSHCWAWKAARDQDENDRQSASDRAAAQMQLALIGAGDRADAERTMDPRKWRALMEAELVYSQIATQRGELVTAKDVEQTFDDVLSLVRKAVSTWPDRLQRELDLDHAQMARAIALSDDLFGEIRRRLEDYANRDPASAGPDEDDLMAIAS